MNHLSILDMDIFENQAVKSHFFKNGKAVEDSPVWGMSLLEASSMRFRYNETNDNRPSFFEKLFAGRERTVTPVELIHSKIVYAVSSSSEIACRTGDGVITKNACLCPTVTVADCMPLFLFDPETRVFGALHSGWKGTGIIEEALKTASEKYGAKAKDFLVAIGAHIKSCCYEVDCERASFFRSQFGENAALERDGKWYLSLLDANLNILRRAGVKDENITVLDNCTCCTKMAGKSVFGSYRRETRSTAGVPFTVQAAFCYWE